MNAHNMPRLPEHNIEKPERRITDLQPGEKAIVINMLALQIDEGHHVWVNSTAPVASGGHTPPLTSRIQRTESGFILWLDKKSTFTPRKLAFDKPLIPVVEFRHPDDGEVEDGHA